MKRRQFVTGGAISLLVPRTLHAEPRQQRKKARVGVVSQLALADTPQIFAFRDGLRERGYADGENVLIDWRWAHGDVKRFPELVADLVRLNVDVLVATVDPAIEAARTATHTTPIVMVVASDPVRLGFVKSLARPGGNITGLTWQTREAVPKRLQLLKDAIPNLSSVAVVWDANEPGRREQVEEAKRAAPTVGVKLHIFEVRSPQELDGAFTAMADAGAAAVLVEASTMMVKERARIAALAVQRRVAAIGWWRGLAEAGCLMSYSPSIMEQYRRAGYFAAKILDGAKPADLPVEQPTTFEFVVNLGTAKRLGLTIPQSLLARADEIIQ